MQRWEELAYAKEEGREEGREEGLAQGLAEGIIGTSLEYGLSEKSILEKLQEKLLVGPEKAQEYFDGYTRGKRCRKE